MQEIIRIATFKDILGNFHGGKILDVACGAGQFIEILVESLASWEHITGLDLTDEIMKDARQKFNGNNFSFVEGNALALPFESDSFNMVCISSGLHHVPDTIKTVKEMMRVVKKPGSLLISENRADGLNPAQESSKMYHHLRVEVDRLLGNDHFETFTLDELQGLMDAVGLTGMQVFEYLEPTADPFDPGIIGEYVAKMEGWMDELQGYPEAESIRRKIKRVEKMMKTNGFARPPLLIFFGKK